jgi:DNA-directed RNA polymerase subunit RPC12/RpoP
MATMVKLNIYKCEVCGDKYQDSFPYQNMQGQIVCPYCQSEGW